MNTLPRHLKVAPSSRHYPGSMPSYSSSALDHQEPVASSSSPVLHPDSDSIGRKNSRLGFRESKRVCWVCLSNEQDDPQDTIWVCPCKCRGSLKWVHEECLQKWIDEQQARRTNLTRVSCSQCKTQYILSFPPNSTFISLVEQYDKFLYNSSPLVTLAIAFGAVYWCCMSYGTVCVLQMMGTEEGHNFIIGSEPIYVFAGLPSIPIVLLTAKLIRWEDLILHCWKTRSIKIPAPLSFVLGEPPANPRANCDLILVEKGYSDPMGFSRMLCGALLLPTMSALVGRILFKRLTSSNLQRSILGGLTFLLAKGALRIFLRKSQYMRYSQRTIENYIESASNKKSADGGDNKNLSGKDNSDDSRQLDGGGYSMDNNGINDLQEPISPNDSLSDDDLTSSAVFSVNFRFGQLSIERD